MRILLLTFLAAACATSSAELQVESSRHRQAAASAASVNDYSRAAAESAKADELHAQAVKRAYKEGRSGDLVFTNQ
jgi:hypothetical protein